MAYAINFWKGFENGLITRFAKLSNEKAIVLYDKVKEAWEKSVAIVPLSSPKTSFIDGKQEGFKSATEANLNPAVPTSKGGLLK